MTESSGPIAGADRPAARSAGKGLRNLTIMAAVALSLLTSSLALADPPDRDRDHHEWRHDDHDRGEHRGDWHRDHRDDRDDRRHDEDRYRDFDSGDYWRPHGYYRHHWHRGDRLPMEFRAPVYVVPDVAVYHLRPPPPGYCWVRVDNNAVLTVVATGVVVDVALNLFH
jgi:Ni/Co efflux regulator RcnB